ncbi:hypothetical protein CO015_05500 [candidate division WWE3 bacterium CG_4_8_14_3_um_filter_42_11]|uniref:Uncharacterized protein n=2 Tax=Katanobacteria TaxID=422282 RepID=A0A2M7WZ53_UNCKA|nr:MAG: hypothetical protein CO181_00050 [candidate division WWE3 bacterium CG_4_9_14_3_um_filter_43_9]PJC68037.1 MAG: hypothetical protein CO015_05500 [candidate division WWE3 bacterium CG_4_8_14_3_um_filter_42_11]
MKVFPPNKNANFLLLYINLLTRPAVFKLQGFSKNFMSGKERIFIIFDGSNFYNRLEKIDRLFSL